MEDRDLILPYPVVDDVRVAAEPESVDAEALDYSASPGQVGKLRNSFLYESLDLVCRTRVPPVQELVDGLAIGECACRVANPHMPWRLSDSATT